MTMTASSFLNPYDVFFRNFLNNVKEYTDPSQSKSSYPVDIYLTKEGAHFEIPVSGIQKENIKVHTENSLLRITYTPPPSKKPSTSEVLYLCKGVTRRSFDLGYKFTSKFDLSNTTATFKDGFLKILVPVAEQVQAKEIPIK